MRILVTGATAGIGRALAGQLVEAGHEVIGVARSRERLSEAAATLGPRFVPRACDLANEAARAGLLAELTTPQLLPDVVVLNAGIYPHDADGLLDYDVARAVLATNLDASLHCVAALLPPFTGRGSGRFVAVSSVLAVRPDPLGVSYAASKAGLTMAFRSLAVRYAGSGVRFNAILFGPVVTRDDEPPPGRLSPRITADAAARAIIASLNSRQVVSYSPGIFRWLFGASAWLSDPLFEKLVKPFKR